MKKTITYGAEPTILAVMQKYTAINKTVETDEEVIKAGTPIAKSDLNEVTLPTDSADDVLGIALYDVEVGEDGQASVPVLVRGIVNVDKLDEVPSQDIQDALKDVQFISKGGLK